PTKPRPPPNSNQERCQTSTHAQRTLRSARCEAYQGRGSYSYKTRGASCQDRYSGAATSEARLEEACGKETQVKPMIAIVGRPNVGKSPLFNRLAGQKLAIVHDTPGVTRDRHYADTLLQGREVTIVDTGGFDPNDDDPMHQGIARHVHAAVEQADVILCILDAQSPPTEADRHAVQLLRQSLKPVVYFANRADNPSVELEAIELHRLGLGQLIAG